MKKFMATVLLAVFLPFVAVSAFAQAPVIDAISPPTGLSLGGTLVTIRGSNLAATTSVTIGGAALANLVADNATTLRGNVPAGTAGAVDVTVMTSEGSDTLVDGFTYKNGTPAARFALSFDGSDDLVEVPDDAALDISGDFTLEAWVKLPPAQDTAQYTSPIVCKGINNFDTTGNFWLNVRNADNRLFLGIGDGVGGSQSLIGATNLGTGEWVHVAGVRSSESLSVYVNGVLDGSAARAVNQQVNDAPIRLGGIPSVAGAMVYLQGLIDDVRVWNVARSVQQIQDAMHRPLRRREAGLVGYWKLDQGTGQGVTDSSRSGNAGVLGATSATETADPVWVTSDAPIRRAR